jgi:hypothetical protein
MINIGGKEYVQSGKQVCLLVKFSSFSKISLEEHESFIHLFVYNCLPLEIILFGDCSDLWHYSFITGTSHTINAY